MQSRYTKNTASQGTGTRSISQEVCELGQFQTGINPLIVLSVRASRTVRHRPMDVTTSQAQGPTCSLCRQDGALGSARLAGAGAWEGGTPCNWAHGCVLVTVQQSLTLPSGRLPAWTSGMAVEASRSAEPFRLSRLQAFLVLPSWAEQTAWSCVTHL